MSAIRISAAISLVVALAAAPAHAQRDTVRVGAATLRSLALPTGVDSSDTYAVRKRRAPPPRDVRRGGHAHARRYLIVGRNVRPNGAVVSLDSVAVATGRSRRCGTPTPRAAAARACASPASHARHGGRQRGRANRDRLGVPAACTTQHGVARREPAAAPRGYAVVLPSYDIHRGRSSRA
jgi:hypothetical protein